LGFTIADLFADAKRKNGLKTVPSIWIALARKSKIGDSLFVRCRRHQFIEGAAKEGDIVKRLLGDGLGNWP
jgi:hypothetical protein